MSARDDMPPDVQADVACARDDAVEVYDPYALVDPHDRTAVREARRLARAARHGQVRIAGESDEAFARRAASSRSHGSSRRRARQVQERGGSAVPARSRRLGIAAAACALVVVLVGVAGVTSGVLGEADGQRYSSVGVSIAGVAADDFIVTPEELVELECVELSVTGTGAGAQGESKAGTVTAYGPTVQTFLAAYGLEATDFTRITFLCKDGYTVTVAREALQDDIILSVASGDDALDGYQQPLRVVIPDESSGQWCYGVLRIEFES